jgi:hypothetical protein
MDRRAFLLGAAALPAAAHAAPPVPPAPAGVSLTHLKTFSVAECASLVKLVGIQGVTPRYAVNAWRMLYPSRDGAGRPIVLSGLLALPDGVAPTQAMGWLHGTTTDRTAVPSRMSTDGIAGAVLFGGTGYATFCPDYLGLGASPLVHTYLVADDAARAVIDMLDGARGVDGFPAAPPTLLGFSQGAHAALAAQRTLEAKGRKVRASVAVAGAHHLWSLEFPAALKGGSPNHLTYLTYIARGYAARYGRPLDSVLTAKMAALSQELYDTPHPPEQVRAALTGAPRDLFQPAVLEAFDDGRQHWFLEALKANETAHFKPRAPVRLYYGSKDTDVLPQDAVDTAAAMARRGADAVAVDVAPVGHDASLIAAAGPALAWLDSLPG